MRLLMITLLAALVLASPALANTVIIEDVIQGETINATSAGSIYFDQAVGCARFEVNNSWVGLTTCNLTVGDTVYRWDSFNHTTTVDFLSSQFPYNDELFQNWRFSSAGTGSGGGDTPAGGGGGGGGGGVIAENDCDLKIVSPSNKKAVLPFCGVGDSIEEVIRIKNDGFDSETYQVSYEGSCAGEREITLKGQQSGEIIYTCDCGEEFGEQKDAAVVITKKDASLCLARIDVQTTSSFSGGKVLFVAGGLIVFILLITITYLGVRSS